MPVPVRATLCKADRAPCSSFWRLYDCIRIKDAQGRDLTGRVARGRGSGVYCSVAQRRRVADSRRTGRQTAADWVACPRRRGSGGGRGSLWWLHDALPDAASRPFSHQTILPARRGGGMKQPTEGFTTASQDVCLALSSANEHTAVPFITVYTMYTGQPHRHHTWPDSRQTPVVCRNNSPRLD